MSVDIICRGAGHPRRECPCHHRPADERRAVAVAFGIGDGGECQFVTAVSCCAGGNPGYQNALAEYLWRIITLDLYLQPRHQQRTGALSLQDGASVQVAFVADTRIECTTLRRRFVTRFQKIVSVMIGFTVGGVIPACYVKLACCHLRHRFTVVVIPRRDGPRYHAVGRVQIPHCFGSAVAHPRRVTQRQRQAALIATLVVVKLDNPDFQSGVGTEPEPDTHLRQQP